MPEAHKQLKIVTYQPLTVFCKDGAPISGKMIELSATGAQFLCRLSPQAQAELELKFNLTHQGKANEFRLKARVLHSSIAASKPPLQADGIHAIAVEFIDMHQSHQTWLDEYVGSARST